MSPNGESVSISENLAQLTDDMKNIGGNAELIGCLQGRFVRQVLPIGEEHNLIN